MEQFFNVHSKEAVWGVGGKLGTLMKGKSQWLGLVLTHCIPVVDHGALIYINF